MVLNIALQVAITILKRVLVALKAEAVKSSTVLDDIAIKALEDVISLYQSGKLSL